MGSTPNLARPSGDLPSMNRVKESVDGKIGGDIKGRGILAKLIQQNYSEGRSWTYVSKVALRNLSTY